MTDIQQELDYTIPEFIYSDNEKEIEIKIHNLILGGAMLTNEMIDHYKFLDEKNRCKKLKTIVEDCHDQLQENKKLCCDHSVFEEEYCIDCGISYKDFQENCKHSWVPAGAKKNKDRIHNKGNGNGKYQAYKCEKCGYFKRRFLK